MDVMDLLDIDELNQITKRLSDAIQNTSEANAKDLAILFITKDITYMNVFKDREQAVVAVEKFCAGV